MDSRGIGTMFFDPKVYIHNISWIYPNTGNSGWWWLVKYSKGLVPKKTIITCICLLTGKKTACRKVYTCLEECYFAYIANSYQIWTTIGFHIFFTFKPNNNHLFYKGLHSFTTTLLHPSKSYGFFYWGPGLWEVMSLRMYEWMKMRVSLIISYQLSMSYRLRLLSSRLGKPPSSATSYPMALSIKGPSSPSSSSSSSSSLGDPWIRTPFRHDTPLIETRNFWVVPHTKKKDKSNATKRV